MPCSIVTAWNNLYEAAVERVDFYGINRGTKFLPWPEVPCRKIGESDITYMRNVIRNLLRCSFDHGKFDQWLNYEDAGYNVNDKALFDRFGADYYAFMRQASQVPMRRQTLSDFIRAAARMVNNAVRYPLPSWVGPWGKSGFCIQCNMQIQAYDKDSGDYNGKSYYGTWLEDGQLRLDKMQTAGNNISYGYKKVGRGRSWDHHLVYLPGSVSDDYESVGHLNPALRGMGRFRIDFGVSSWRAGSAECGVQEFNIDFATGRADGNLEYSAASEIIEKVWNMDFPILDIDHADIVTNKYQAFLKEENFPELPYKYVE